MVSSGSAYLPVSFIFLLTPLEKKNESQVPCSFVEGGVLVCFSVVATNN